MEPPPLEKGLVLIYQDHVDKTCNRSCAVVILYGVFGLEWNPNGTTFEEVTKKPPHLFSSESNEHVLFVFQDSEGIPLSGQSDILTCTAARETSR